MAFWDCFRGFGHWFINLCGPSRVGSARRSNYSLSCHCQALFFSVRGFRSFPQASPIPLFDYQPVRLYALAARMCARHQNASSQLELHSRNVSACRKSAHESRNTRSRGQVSSASLLVSCLDLAQCPASTPQHPALGEQSRLLPQRCPDSATLPSTSTATCAHVHATKPPPKDSSSNILKSTPSSGIQAAQRGKYLYTLGPKVL